MAKGYSARGGFTGGAGMMRQQQQMQQKILKMQQEMEKAQTDVEMLQDLVISAVNEALRQAEDAMENSMQGLTGGLNIPGFNL